MFEYSLIITIFFSGILAEFPPYSSMSLTVQRKPPLVAATLLAYLSGVTDNEISGNGKEALNLVDILMGHDD